MSFKSNPQVCDATIIDTACIVNSNDLELALNFVANLQISEPERNKIKAEISLLFWEVSKFNSGLGETQKYKLLLDAATQLIINSECEDDILDKLVPIWSQQRGSAFSKDKPVDEFYRETEYYTLWYLLVQGATDQAFNSYSVSKMRAIIRRYSNMPALWYFLCQISGEELKTAYTF